MTAKKYFQTLSIGLSNIVGGETWPSGEVVRPVDVPSPRDTTQTTKQFSINILEYIYELQWSKTLARPLGHRIVC